MASAWINYLENLGACILIVSVCVLVAQDRLNCALIARLFVLGPNV